MFPGYLFGRFVYSQQHRAAEYAPGVQGIVQFGAQVPTLEPEVIDAIRLVAGDDEVVTIDPEIKVGQTVQVLEGPLEGLHVVVTRVLPARERIRVLVEFLGRSVETELPTPRALPVDRPRLI